ncbi:MAG: MFS transporter [Pyrinomonadaceae bacterium]|nr:MFS transporter [Pyrinomonadaceae bacterium]
MIKSVSRSLKLKTATPSIPTVQAVSQPGERLILFALWLLVFSASSQIMIISPMLPQIGAQLKIPEAWQGTLVSSYALMVGVCALVTGPISDKFGRRRVLLAGTGLMTLALALHAAAASYAALLLMRALAGAAGGVLSGAAVSYVGDYFPYERRGWANGLIMSSTAMGQILGVPLGTLLAGRYGFRAPFLLFALTMGATFLLIWRFVPQPKVRRSTGRLTIRVAFKSYVELLRRPATLAAAATYALMFLSIALYVIYLPTWLTIEHKASPAQIASLFLVGGIANAMTGPAAGKLSDRLGRKALILSSCGGLIVLMLSTTFLVRAFWVAYPLFFLLMMFVAARMSPLQALLSALVEDEQRGKLLSLAISVGQLGFAAGGALAGIAYTRHGYVSNTMAAAVAVFLMALLVWRYLPEPNLVGRLSAPHIAPDG